MQSGLLFFSRNVIYSVFEASSSTDSFKDLHPSSDKPVDLQDHKTETKIKYNTKTQCARPRPRPSLYTGLNGNKIGKYIPSKFRKHRNLK